MARFNNTADAIGEFIATINRDFGLYVFFTEAEFLSNNDTWVVISNFEAKKGGEDEDGNTINLFSYRVHVMPEEGEDLDIEVTDSKPESIEGCFSSQTRRLLEDILKAWDPNKFCVA